MEFVSRRRQASFEELGFVEFVRRVSSYRADAATITPSCSGRCSSGSGPCPCRPANRRAWFVDRGRNEDGRRMECPETSRIVSAARHNLGRRAGFLRRDPSAKNSGSECAL
jgi:hypothetical protein